MSNQPSEISYAGRIGMSHAIDIHGVQFFANYALPGNALAQFEGWIEKIVQEEVEKRTGEAVRNALAENTPESPQPVEPPQVDLAQRSGVVPHYQWTNGEVVTLRAEVDRLKTEYRACGIERAEYHVELHLAREQIANLKHELDRSRNAHGKAELEVARLKQIITNMEDDL